MCVASCPRPHQAPRFSSHFTPALWLLYLSHPQYHFSDQILSNMPARSNTKGESSTQRSSTQRGGKSTTEADTQQGSTANDGNGDDNESVYSYLSLEPIVTSEVISSSKYKSKGITSKPGAQPPVFKGFTRLTEIEQMTGFEQKNNVRDLDWGRVLTANWWLYTRTGQTGYIHESAQLCEAAAAVYKECSFGNKLDALTADKGAYLRYPEVDDSTKSFLVLDRTDIPTLKRLNEEHEASETQRYDELLAWTKTGKTKTIDDLLDRELRAKGLRR